MKLKIILPLKKLLSLIVFCLLVHLTSLSQGNADIMFNNGKGIKSTAGSRVLMSHSVSIQAGNTNNAILNLKRSGQTVSKFNGWGNLEFLEPGLGIKWSDSGYWWKWGIASGGTLKFTGSSGGDRMVFHPYGSVEINGKYYNDRDNLWMQRSKISLESDGVTIASSQGGTRFRYVNEVTGEINYNSIQMYIGDRIGIGTDMPDETLTVKGNIHAEGVKVDLNVPGPDYVFEDSYELRSLQSTHDFIQSNKHLPEVPSAKQMEEQGINLGEMNMVLLKKVEELTLHLIIQEEKISNLNETVETLHKKLED